MSTLVALVAPLQVVAGMVLDVVLYILIVVLY